MTPWKTHAITITEASQRVKDSKWGHFSVRRRIIGAVDAAMGNMAHNGIEEDFMEKSTKDKATTLKGLISNLEAAKADGNRWDSVDQLLTHIYAFLKWLSHVDPETDVNSFLGWEFYALTRSSQRKVALHAIYELFGEEYEALSEKPSEETRQAYVRRRAKELQQSLLQTPHPIMHLLLDQYRMDSRVEMFYYAFILSEAGSANLEETLDDYGISPDSLLSLSRGFPGLGINEQRLNTALGVMQEPVERFLQKGGDIWKGETRKLTEEVLSESDVNGFINPNWFLHEINILEGYKNFGGEKTRYLFTRYFREMIEDINQEHDLGIVLPDFWNMLEFRLRKNENKSTSNGERTPQIVQHILEWDVPDDFSETDLQNLGVFMGSVFSDWNLSAGGFKRFHHPIRTLDGRLESRGFFEGTRDFDNSHLIQIRSSNRKSKLRLAFDSWQDEFIYCVTQISHYIRHRKLIDKHQLFASIYQQYNLATTRNTPAYDISIFESQYQEIIERIIWPLSREYIQEYGHPWKPHNTVAVGIHGTGKSQFLSRLLGPKRYTDENWELHLNAVAINMSVMELIGILQSGPSGFKKRLSDIHENTKQPILLTIEDIDTIVNEEGGKADIVTQALTTLFEWVGSLPVTVATSTNYPERLPARLLRPNRFDTIIPFQVPLPNAVRKLACETHLKNSGVDKIIQGDMGWTIEKFLDQYLGKFEYFTTSHIGAFISSISEHYRFKKRFNKPYYLTPKIVEELFRKMLISTREIQERQKEIDTWWEEQRGKEKAKIGF